MPKIVVSLADPEERQRVCAGLQSKKHDVIAIEPATAKDSPKGISEKLLAEKATVAVMDYLIDDAASVKMLQAATDSHLAPRFIFILPEGVSRAHVLMAVNEGASALLERPVNVEALANYVGRAINGPSRLRYEAGRETAAAQELADARREAKSMQQQLASKRKLLSYLMSTPVSSQHRSVMVVSDSAYQRDYLRKLLEEHGFHVSLAQNPEEGLKVALDEKPRIVISDLEMDGMNGIEFCRNLKIVHKFIPCFFVVCTANREKFDAVMAPGNGVDACVIKPSGASDDQELIAAAAMGLLL